MKISMKQMLVIWAVLLVVVAGLFWSAYSRLKPESFVTLVKEQVEKNYPGSSLNVGDVKYTMAVDFSLKMKNLILTRSGKVLGSIGDLEMRIPWWLLLLNRGSALISLSNLEIFVDHDEAPTPNPVKEAIDKNNRTIRVVLPGYLSDAKYTLKAKNISVRDSKNSRRYFRLSKLLVREFQYGKNSAFELNIPVEISHKGSQYTSDLWLFGDVTPEKNLWQLNYRGEFRTQASNDKLQMEDLIIDGKANINPAQMNIDSKLELLVDKESVGAGSFSANDNELIVDVKLTKFPLSFLDMIEKEVKNPFLTEISGTSSGNLRISKKSSEEVAQLKGSLNFDGTINLGETTINGKWKLVANGSKWETSFISPKGEISFFRRSIVDFTQGIVTQYNEEIGFSGMDAKIAVHSFLTLGHLVNDPASVYHNSTVSLNNCFWDKKTINGDVKYGISPDQRFYTATISGENLSLQMNYLEKNSSHQIMITAQNFPVIEELKIFDPYFRAKRGVLTGKVEGQWSSVWSDGTWVASMDIKNLQSLQGLLGELSSKSAQEFSLDDASSNHQSFNLIHRNQTLNLNSLFIDGNDPAKISGVFSYVPNSKSYLTLSHPGNRSWKPVRKDLVAPIWPTKVEP